MGIKKHWTPVKQSKESMFLYRKLNLLKDKIFTLVLMILILEFCFPHQLLAQEINNSITLGPVLTNIENDSAAQTLNPTSMITKKPKAVRYLIVTAYSSTPDQCDATPFITANGKIVYDGLVAANFLKFDSEIKIPEYFGDKIFTVNDRMNKKYSDRVDVWMPTREEALQFGARHLKVEIY